MYSHLLANTTKKILHIQVNGYQIPDVTQTDNILLKIRNNPDFELIIFDKSEGPCNNDLDYVTWADSLVLGQEYIIATSNFVYYYNKHPKIVYVPFYFFDLLQSENLIRPDITRPRPHKISCLNRNPWLHKSVNLVAMQKQSWFKDLQFSFGVDNLQEIRHPKLLNFITAEEIEYLQTDYPKRLNLTNDNLGYHASNACPTYQQCYIDYAPESRHDQNFISEKTWKPIFSGQFFFILGPCGIVQYLRDIGIDVFGDLIDYSYDYEPDLANKISLLMSSITKFLEHDLDQVWIDTLSRRKKNLDLMYDPDFHNLLLNDITSRVS